MLWVLETIWFKISSMHHSTKRRLNIIYQMQGSHGQALMRIPQLMKELNSISIYSMTLKDFPPTMKRVNTGT
jgi:hypothetical protein